MNSRKNARCGFSLIEVLIVIAILGLLATVVIVNFDGLFGNAQIDTTRQKIQGFDPVMTQFRIHNNSYPTTAEGLAALLTQPAGRQKWRGPYIESDEALLDAWGNPFQYRFPGEQNTGKYDLWSMGPDGVNSGDDITNWGE